MSPTDQVQRREFLLQGSAAAALGVAAINSAQAEDKKSAKDELKPELLEKFVGEQFTIVKESKEHGRQSAKFVLREVKTHKHVSDRSRPTHVRSHGCSLLFVPETGTNLEDGIYRVEHEKLGAQNLFLSRTHRDSKKGKKPLVHFVAVFN